MGYIIGSACGVIELLLLHVLVKGISAGSVKIWVVPVKLGVLALSFLFCAFVVPDQLYKAAIAAAAVLIVGAIFMSVMSIKKNNSRGAETPQTERDAT